MHGVVLAVCTCTRKIWKTRNSVSDVRQVSNDCRVYSRVVTSFPCDQRSAHFLNFAVTGDQGPASQLHSAYHYQNQCITGFVINFWTEHGATCMIVVQSCSSKRKCLGERTALCMRGRWNRNVVTLWVADQVKTHILDYFSLSQPLSR